MEKCQSTVTSPFIYTIDAHQWPFPTSRYIAHGWLAYHIQQNIYETDSITVIPHACRDINIKCPHISSTLKTRVYVYNTDWFSDVFSHVMLNCDESVCLFWCFTCCKINKKTDPVGVFKVYMYTLLILNIRTFRKHNMIQLLSMWHWLHRGNGCNCKEYG